MTDRRLPGGTTEASTRLSSRTAPLNAAAWSTEWGRHEELHFQQETYFHVGDDPRRFLRTGSDREVGAALFYDDPREPGQAQEIVTGDWAWVALNPEPLAHAPTIYYDQPTPVIFPRRAVLPLDRLRAVVLEWTDTGRRPTCVDWLAVNSLSWELDETGEVLDS